MKVAGSARSNCRTTLQNYAIELVIGDADLDAHIRGVRKALGRATHGGMADETEILVKALMPMRDALADAIPDDFDQENWAALLWDWFTACVSNTQAAAACPAVTQSESAWADMIVVLLATPSISETIVINTWWSTRRMATCWLALLGVLLLLTASRELPGRWKFWALITGTSSLASAEAWRQYGWNLFVARVIKDHNFQQVKFASDGLDNASVASPSNRLRSELEDLKRQMAGMQAGPPPGLAAPLGVPAGAPPLPPPSALLQSMQAMATGAVIDRPMINLAGPAAAAGQPVAPDILPPIQPQFTLGDLVEFKI